MTAHASNLVAFQPGQEPTRQPPNNVECEQALLGALLVEPSCLDRVRDSLLPEHFFQPVHGRIFEAVCKTVDRGQRPSPATLKLFFVRDDALADVGGASYLDRLAASVVSVINVETYAGAIVDTYQRREVISECEATVRKAYDPIVDESAGELAEQHSAAIDRIRGIITTRDFITAAQTSEAALADAEAMLKGRPTAIRTGLADFDSRVRIKDGQLIVVAARPSMGKTALGQMIATVTAQRDFDLNPEHPSVTAFFSFEMEAAEIGQRDQAMRTGIPYFRIGAGEFSAPEFLKLNAAGETFAKLPLVLSTRRGMTVQGVRSRCKALRRKRRISAIVVDYLQLMRPERSTGNYAADIGSISRGLKELAGELECPVFAMAQISRESEKQDDKRPTMANIKYSGDIEADADTIILLHRPAKHDSHADPLLLEANLDKQRQGPTTTWATCIRLGYDQALSRFFDLQPPMSGFDLGHPNAPGRA